MEGQRGGKCLVVLFKKVLVPLTRQYKIVTVYTYNILGITLATESKNNTH